jgi:hypothetical protein
MMRLKKIVREWGDEMRRALLTIAIFASATGPLFAAEGKGIRFWNLTASTISNLQLSPSGKDRWGKNQCENDADGAVDHDERLKITGIEPGKYDVRLANKQGRVCIVRNIDLRPNAVFSIEEKELTNCGTQ